MEKEINGIIPKEGFKKLEELQEACDYMAKSAELFTKNGINLDNLIDIVKLEGEVSKATMSIFSVK